MAETLQQRRRQETALELSLLALEMFAERGFVETLVEKVAAAAGVSALTFHRYFATKEQSVAPALDAGWQLLVDVLRERPADEPLVDSLVTSLESCLQAETAVAARAFLRVLPDLPVLQPTWLGVSHRFARAVLSVLADRLDLDPASPRAAFVASVVAAANQVAVETWAHQPQASVMELSRECLIAVSASLLSPTSP